MSPESAKIALSRFKFFCVFVITSMSFTSLKSNIACAADNDIISPSTATTLIRELKFTSKLNINVSQSRLFHMNCRVARTSISDFHVAEVVVVSENEFYLLGKSPGISNVMLWGEDGSTLGIRLIVKEKGAEDLPETTVPFTNNPSIKLQEQRVTTEALADFKKSRAAMNAVRHSEDLDRRWNLRPGEAYESGRAVKSAPEEDPRLIDFNPQNLDPSLNISIESSTSRIFWMLKPIKRIHVGDSKIVELVLFPAIEKSFVLLGEKPGKTNLAILDDDGNLINIDMQVKEHSSSTDTKKKLSEVQQESWIPPIDTKRIDLQEDRIGQTIDLQLSQPAVFCSNEKILRTCIADPSIVEIVPAGNNAVYLIGKAVGETTLLIWDEYQTSSSLKLSVKNGPTAREKSSLPPFSLSREPGEEIEYWSGSRKDVQAWPPVVQDKK